MFRSKIAMVLIGGYKDIVELLKERMSKYIEILYVNI